MRVGESIHLGLVEAEIADHGDCARYAITCPFCHEALFKGVRRDGRDGKATHYFSHYREVPSDQVERCELRAASITKEQIEASRAEARGQALAVFVADYRDCLLRAPWFGRVGLEASDVALRRIERRPVWRSFARSVQTVARRAWGDDDLMCWEADRENTARMNAEQGLDLRWSAEAEHHAAGMLAHALAPGSAQSWVSLFTATAACGLAVLKPTPPTDRDFFRQWDGAGLSAEDAAVLATHDGLLLTPDTRLSKVLKRLDAQPDPFAAGTTMLHRAMSTILDSVSNVLTAIPYADILRERAGLPLARPRPGRRKARGETPPWPPVRAKGEGDFAANEVLGDATTISLWSRRAGVTPNQIPGRTAKSGAALWTMLLPPDADVDAEARRALDGARSHHLRHGGRHTGRHKVWFEGATGDVDALFTRLSESGTPYILAMSGGSRVHALAWTDDRALAEEIAGEVPGALLARDESPPPLPPRLRCDSPARATVSGPQPTPAYCKENRMGIRTVTLTDRPPVRIDEDRWPLIASSKWQSEFDNQPYVTYRLSVRQHEDGRAIVYATYSLNPCFTENGEGAEDALGVLLEAGQDIPEAVRELGRGIVGDRHDRGAADSLVRECLADMPAEDLD